MREIYASPKKPKKKKNYALQKVEGPPNDNEWLLIVAYKWNEMPRLEFNVSFHLYWKKKLNKKGWFDGLWFDINDPTDG